MAPQGDSHYLIKSSQRVYVGQKGTVIHAATVEQEHRFPAGVALYDKFEVELARTDMKAVVYVTELSIEWDGHGARMDERGKERDWVLRSNMRIFFSSTKG